MMLDSFTTYKMTNLKSAKLKTFTIFIVLQLSPFLLEASSIKNMTKLTDELQKTYTILGFGDSITEGKGENKSYLFPLWKRLYTAGYLTDFIGPNAHDSQIGSIDNAGFGGRNAEYLDAQTDSIYTKYPADIVLLHTGHNHFAEEVVQAVEAIPENLLMRADSLAWRSGSPLWEMVAANTFWHYPEHREAIKHWQEERKSGV